MAMDPRRASRVVEETFARAWVGFDELPDDEHRAQLWLLKIAIHVAGERLPRSPEVNFDVLDETLRNEATRTDVVRSLSDPQRDLLLWDLKQGCMTSVINCLGPGERAAFVAAQILKLPDEDGAKVLGVTVSAYRVRLSRARQKIGDYLAPRCEHVDPMNPCRCPARVGTALRKGFITPSRHRPRARAPSPSARRPSPTAATAPALASTTPPSATSPPSTAACPPPSSRPSCASASTTRSISRSSDACRRSARQRPQRGPRPGDVGSEFAQGMRLRRRDDEEPALVVVGIRDVHGVPWCAVALHGLHALDAVG
jgi:DNA-directed RNA polymerase specialized sigma24 family protein